jgi:hypothetical protein
MITQNPRKFTMSSEKKMMTLKSNDGRRDIRDGSKRPVVALQMEMIKQMVGDRALNPKFTAT